MMPRSDSKVAAIIFVIALVAGFSMGVLYGFTKGTDYLREQCETNNMFYYKHNDTTYYCATEHQLRKYQK